MAAACIDIDNFKLINDVDGVRAGRRGAAELAAILREEAEGRHRGAPVGRLLPVLLFPYARREDALDVCKRIAERAR